jgi:hypothetical protein
MKLDTTVLQSNTACDLISHIKQTHEMLLKLKDGKKISKKKFDDILGDYEKIISTHVDALHRRIGNTRYERSFVDYDETEEAFNNGI